MKANAKIITVLSMVLLLTFMTGSTAFDVDSLNIDKDIHEDMAVNDNIDPGNDLKIEKSDSIENNESKLIENQEINQRNQENSQNENQEINQRNQENSQNENQEINQRNQKNSQNENQESDLIENHENSYLNEAETSTQENLTDESDNCDGIVMCEDTYSCGPASLATVLNHFGLNLTLNDVSSFTDTTEENGTSMLSLIKASKHFGFNAVGVKLNVRDLKENYIAHISINGSEHWTVIKNITDEYVSLQDPNEGNIIFKLDMFSDFFTGNALIINKETNQSIEEKLTENITLLSDNDSSRIFGKRLVKKVIGYKTVWKYGLVKHYGWKLKPVVSSGEIHFSQWQYVKGYYYSPGWYKVKEAIYKVYTVSDESLTSATVKSVKKASKTLKKSSKSKTLKSSKKTTKKTSKKTKK